MITNNVDWFRYDNYFRQWFRVLLRGGGEFLHQVEIPVTPLNPNSTNEWNNIGAIFIHRKDIRYSVMKDSDIWTHNLPDDVYGTVIEKIGKEKTNFLLNGNILPLIDWNKFNRNDNGGCILGSCQKDFSWYFNHTYQDDEVVSVSLGQEYKLLRLINIEPRKNTIVIGGMLVSLSDYCLMTYGYYDLTTGYVSIEVNYSANNQEHISRFSQRLVRHWDLDVVTFFEKMKEEGKISKEVFDNLIIMVNTANNNLMMIESSRVE